MPKGVEYSQEIVTAICSEIAKGKKLVDVCAMDGMPTRSTFYLWMKDHPGVSDMYTRAREERAELIADEILEIADAPIEEPKADEDGKILPFEQSRFRQTLEQRRQMIDARKWAAAKLNPKVYGDRVNLDADVRIPVPDAQLESRLAFLIGKAGTALIARGAGEAQGEAEAVHALPGDGAS